MAEGSRQKRQSPRAKLLMAASLEHDGVMTPVTLRDLSAEGALVEGDLGLAPGGRIVFRKGELAVPGRVAWAAGRRAGLAFAVSLDPEAVLRHVPPPAPAPPPLDEEVYKRPGFRGRLSREERRQAEILWGQPLPSAKP